MFETYESYVLFWGVFAGIAALLLQRVLKKQVDPSQYAYLRDLLLMGAWILLTIWLGSPQTRFLVGVAVFAAIIGFAREFWPNPMWSLCFLGIGLLSSVFGPAIRFVNFVDGQYIFFTTGAAVIATCTWFFVFPVVLGLLDAVPGLVGHLLGVCFSLMLIAVSLSSQTLGDAFFMSFTGLILLAAFWSRYGHAHRIAGSAMCALWGTLVAGTSIIGVGKGIAFSALLFVPLGLFAVPLIEASLSILTLSSSRDHYYRKLINSGFDHLAAVRLITLLCALVGMGVGAWQLENSWLAWGLITLAVFVVLFSIAPLLRRGEKTSLIPDKKPVMWGVPIDNVSLNYALSRVKGEIRNPRTECGIVATVNALALEEAVVDHDYHDILQNTALTLADGTGLLWALRMLGNTVQERVAGIDFAEHLCRMASVNGWGVYFIGAENDIAERAARQLARKYPGLIISGTHHGFFDFRDEAVPRAIAASGAKIVFAAIGLPRQEKWLKYHGRLLKNCVGVGLGGSFDVISGKFRRAPVWMQRCGLEWLFRLGQQPSRWRRMLGLPVFVIRVFFTKLGFYRYRR